MRSLADPITGSTAAFAAGPEGVTMSNNWSFHDVRALVLSAALLLASASGATAAAGTGAGSELSVVARTGPGLPTRMASLGTHVVVGTDSGLVIVEQEDTSRVLAQLDLASGVQDLAVLAPGMTAIAAGDEGLLLMSTLVPTAPRVLSQVRLGEAVAVAAADGRVLVGLGGEEGNRLVVLDARDPDRPLCIESIELSGRAAAIALLPTGVAVALESPAGVLLLTEDEGHLVDRSFISTMLPPRRLAHVGDRLIVACGMAATGEVLAVDVSDPDSPRRDGRLRLADDARDLLAEGNRVLVATSALGILLLDAPSGEEWTRVGGLPSGQHAVAIACSGLPGRALLARRSSSGVSRMATFRVEADGVWDESPGLALAEVVDVGRTATHRLVLRRDRLDIRNLAPGADMPAPVGSWTLPDADFSRVAVGVGIAAIASGSTIHLLDVSVPATPREVGQVVVSRGAVTSMAFDGATLAVAQGRDVEIHDVAVPAWPRRMAVFAMSEGCTAVASLPGRIVAVGGGRLLVVDTRDVSRPLSIGQLLLPTAAHSVAASGSRAVVGSLEGKLVLVRLDEQGRPALVSSLATEPVSAVAIDGPRIAAVHPDSGVSVFGCGPMGEWLREASLDLPGSPCGVALAGRSIDVAATGGGSFHLELSRPSIVTGLPMPVASRLPRREFRGPTSAR